MATWKEIKSDVEFWKPKIGDELIGKVLEKKQTEYGFQYTIETEDKRKVVTPSHKVLQSRMNGIQIGAEVKIKLDGDEAPKVKGQNRTLIYSVFVKE